MPASFFEQEPGDDGEKQGNRSEAQDSHGKTAGEDNVQVSLGHGHEHERGQGYEEGKAVEGEPGVGRQNIEAGDQVAYAHHYRDDGKPFEDCEHTGLLSAVKPLGLELADGGTVGGDSQVDPLSQRAQQGVLQGGRHHPHGRVPAGGKG